MTRYVGTGDGGWLPDGPSGDGRAWYRYVPSSGDRVTVRELAEAVAARAGERRRRAGYGAAGTSDPRWEARGIMGEVAALYPFGSGPDLTAWSGRGGWHGAPDLGVLEVRTTSTRQLYGFAVHADRYDPGLGGWRVTSKDVGRLIVCVEDRTSRGDLVVHGYADADAVPLLPAFLGAIVAVIEPAQLSPFADLVP